MMQMHHKGGSGFLMAVAENIIRMLKKNDCLGGLKDLGKQIESAAGDIILRFMDRVSYKKEEQADDQNQ